MNTVYASEEFEHRPGDLDRNLRISGDLGRHLAWLEDDLEVGFEEIFLHNVGTNQEAFIDRFGEAVLPQIAR